MDKSSNDTSQGVSTSLPPSERPAVPFAIVALLLQGGGALGAYQAGVY